MVATVLEIRAKSGKVERGYFQGKFEEKRRGKSGNLNRSLEHNSLFITLVQSRDLSFYQNVMSGSQGNFPEVWEKSGRMEVRKNGQPVQLLGAPV